MDHVASLRWPGEYGMNISKKVYHFGKFTFWPKAEVPPSRVNVCVPYAGLRRGSADPRPYLESLGKMLSKKLSWSSVGPISTDRRPDLGADFPRFKMSVEKWRYLHGHLTLDFLMPQSPFISYFNPHMMPNWSSKYHFFTLLGKIWRFRGATKKNANLAYTPCTRGRRRHRHMMKASDRYR